MKPHRHVTPIDFNGTYERILRAQKRKAKAKADTSTVKLPPMRAGIEDSRWANNAHWPLFVKREPNDDWRRPNRKMDRPKKLRTR
jgi:hypothetical protein